VRVAVIGLGMVGGSVARRLARTHDVAGWDADEATRDLARAAGLTVAAGVEDAAAGADVAVVATPPAAVGAVLTALSATDRPVLTDVGSVRSPVLAAARAAGVAARFVGGHPMAGTERTGFAGADPALLDGAAWVLCVEEDTELAAWLRVGELVTGAGCRVVPCSARAHDDAQARISALPHLLACALAVAGGDGGPLAAGLAAGSFRDGTRVAGSRPELITALCDGNAPALARVLDGTLARLTDVGKALRDGGSVRDLATAGHVARRAWADPVPTVTRTLDARSATFRDDLHALGTAGGAVHAIDPDGTVHCRRPDR
jgi:prephenate dehydrogenase